MKLKVYLNNKLYKTYTLPGDAYDPGMIWTEIQIDRDSGLLTSYDLSKGINVRYEKVSDSK
jgi:hypothetical protein